MPWIAKSSGVGSGNSNIAQADRNNAQMRLNTRVDIALSRSGPLNLTRTIKGKALTNRLPMRFGENKDEAAPRGTASRNRDHMYFEAEYQSSAGIRST